MFVSSQLFWYKIVFMIELLISEFLFVFKFKEKENFWLRLVLSLLVCFAVAIFYPIIPGFVNAISTSLMFTVMFILTIVMMKVCYDEPLINIVFCCVSAYTIQHIAFQFYSGITDVAGLNFDYPLGIYSDKQYMNNYNIFTGLIYFICYVFIYWICYLFFGNRIKKNSDMKVKSGVMLIFVTIVVIVCIVLNAVVTYNSYDDYNSSSLMIVRIAIVVSCLLSLAVQFSILTNKEIQFELENVYHLYHQEQKQFSTLKTNIDLINLKCHDLKHQIRNIGSKEFISDESLKEMESVISIYDSTIKTGNETLDIILTEKSLICSQNNISFSCIVDGKKLNFISEVDLYVLFGNALDNAIEAVLQLEDEKRVVSLTTNEIGNLFSINLRNFYKGEMVFESGLPKTTKGDENYHGFGMKSIKLIVEKYQADISIVVEDNIFNLNVLFTLD